MPNTDPFSPLVLGHNSFFGVDHLSAKRGAERAAHFADTDRVMEMIHTAMERGVTGLMLSTHPHAVVISEAIRNDAKARDGLKIYPLLPYAQKYITRANEVGLVNVVFDALAGSSIDNKISAIWKGGMGVLTRDAEDMLSALIRLELNMFRGLNLHAVFLHDALTDLALGLNLRKIFEFYVKELDTAHGAVGGFATKNLPTLLDRFAEWGLEAPAVLTHVNKVGYQMHPSTEASVEALHQHPARVMAMGTLASGYLKPDDAYQFVGQVPGIESIVVGVSSAAHADETFGAIQRHVPVAQSA